MYLSRCFYSVCMQCTENWEEKDRHQLGIKANSTYQISIILRVLLFVKRSSFSIYTNFKSYYFFRENIQEGIFSLSIYISNIQYRLIKLLTLNKRYNFYFTNQISLEYMQYLVHILVCKFYRTYSESLFCLINF